MINIFYLKMWYLFTYIKVLSGGRRQRGNERTFIRSFSPIMAKTSACKEALSWLKDRGALSWLKDWGVPSVKLLVYCSYLHYYLSSWPLLLPILKITPVPPDFISVSAFALKGCSHTVAGETYQLDPWSFFPKLYLCDQVSCSCWPFFLCILLIILGCPTKLISSHSIN